MTRVDRPDPSYWRMRPRSPAPGERVCAIDDLPDPGAREFVFGRGTTTFSMILVRKDEKFFGYLNICPHYSSPLNYRADQFLNDDKTRLRCTMHFAEFRLEDGFGVAGAAENCWLDPVPVHVADDEVRIGDPPPIERPNT